MRKILCMIGTRPEIIKMAPVIEELQSKRNVDLILVHSGQHYDAEMSEIFLKQFDLPPIRANLRIGSGSDAKQTALILQRYEKLISRFHPDIVLAEGDTNTVLGAGLASIKLHVAFGHVEAGLRSFDRLMPEEINRTVADDCAQLCFAPTQRSAQNLMREGIDPGRIHITGNTIVESCNTQLNNAKTSSRVFEQFLLDKGKPLMLVTVHRQENTDDPQKLRNILNALMELEEFQIVYPIHPRTNENIKRYGLSRILHAGSHVICSGPLGYWDFLRLLDASDLVLTDSGGVQEESLSLGVPCLTLRYNTERPETVEAGCNVLVGTETRIIVQQARRTLNERRMRTTFPIGKNPLGDGKAAQRIAKICAGESLGEIRLESPHCMKDGALHFRLIKIRKAIPLRLLEKKHRGIKVTIAYDVQGNPIFPEYGVKLQKGWAVQVLGQPSDLAKLPAHVA
jgi:UDP-N-acetylglucosamine 2-epimerase (non-hydrolysing)